MITALFAENLCSLTCFNRLSGGVVKASIFASLWLKNVNECRVTLPRVDRRRRRIRKTRTGLAGSES